MPQYDIAMVVRKAAPAPDGNYPTWQCVRLTVSAINLQTAKIVTYLQALNQGYEVFYLTEYSALDIQRLPATLVCHLHVTIL